MKMKINITWTPAELAQLQAIYSTTPWSELVTRFGRSRDAIEQKARSIKLVRNFNREPNRPWSTEDDTAMRDMYGKVLVEDIAQLLGRSILCIPKRARILGLAKTRTTCWNSGDWTTVEDRYLQKHLCIVPISHIVECLNRSKVAIYQRMEALGLQGRNGRGTGTGGTALPIGSERIFAGYAMRKVSNTGRSGWKRVDIIDWEAENGLTPKGMVLVKQRGLPRTKENLQLKLIKDVPYLAAIKMASPELKRLRSLKAKISYALGGIEMRQPPEEYRPDKHFSGQQLSSRWTDAQKAYLINNPSHSLKHVSDVVGRSPDSVGYMRRALGLTKPRCKVWHESDLQRLASLYPTHTLRELAAMFECCTWTVARRAELLGISKKKDITCKT